MTAIKLIVGLGNPGRQYHATRHNAGYWLIDNLVEKYSSPLRRNDKFFGSVSTVKIGGNVVHLLKPNTFMNLSGKSVNTFITFYRVSVEQMMIAHDDLDIGCGVIRLKYSGGHGGHNGLRDIIRCSGNRDFYRLRIGIDHPGHASQVTAHVLSNPAAEEKKLIDCSIKKAIEQIPLIVKGDLEVAMQTLHTKPGS